MVNPTTTVLRDYNWTGPDPSTAPPGFFLGRLYDLTIPNITRYSTQMRQYTEVRLCGIRVSVSIETDPMFNAPFNSYTYEQEFEFEDQNFMSSLSRIIPRTLRGGLKLSYMISGNRKFISEDYLPRGSY